MVESCAATLRSHAPSAARGPHTAARKSRTTPSRRVEFQAAPWHGVRASSGTTTRGYAIHGEKRTYSAPKSDSAV
jgi:hypothetical protein